MRSKQPLHGRSGENGISRAIAVHAAARQQEIDAAYLWFEERSAGKGVEFLDEPDRAVRLVSWIDRK